MATPVALEQILGYVPLTGTIQTVKTGIPQPLPEEFFNVTKTTIGNVGRYTQLAGVRNTARRVEYGAPAYAREQKDVGQKTVNLIHTFEELTINPLVFQLLRNYDSYDLQQQGVDEVDRQGKEFRQRFINLRTASVLMSLAAGKIYFDTDGNLLPSSSGAVNTIDFGMNATTNQGQGQDTDGNALITASWATASTNIAGNIRNIIDTSVQRTGYEVGMCLYGRNIPDYITNNTNAQAYLARHPGKREEWLDTGELPRGLFGIDRWIPAHKAFWVDSGATLRRIWDADLCVFCPMPSTDWWDFMEGTYQVPTTLSVVNDTMAARGSMANVQGMFRYAVPTHNPPTYVTYQGDTFLGVLKNPDAVFQLDVTP